MNIFDPLISGSLSVSGSGEISGDLRVIGTLSATVSGTTTNAISASHAAEYLLTSSFEAFTGSHTTGSFTGSFEGDGSGLTNIPASGVTGLNLNRIADGNATASISQADGLVVNTNTIISGSVNITGSISLNGEPIGTGKLDETVFNSYTSSNDTTNNEQNGRLFNLESTTASLNVFTSSADGRLDSLETESGSIRTDLNSYTASNNTTNGVQNGRLDSLETQTGSIVSNFNSYTSSTDTRLNSLELTTGSNINRLNAIESTTSSLSAFTSSINDTIKSKLNVDGVISSSIQVNLPDTLGYTTYSSSVSMLANNLSSSIGSLSSSIASDDFIQVGRITSLEQKTGSYATTGSNQFNGSQTITGSLIVTDNFTVLGSSSIVYSTASQLIVEDNVIVVNASYPAERFAGLEIHDSGSNGSITASLFWDGLNNRFVYRNTSDAHYGGAMFIGGPRNTGSLGDEPSLTSGRLPKSIGGDHIGDSIINETNGSIGIAGSLSITGSIISTETSLVSSSNQISFNGIVDKPTLISGSSQVSFNGIADKPTLVSGSSQILAGTTIHSGTFFNNITVVSGSGQISFTGITDKPTLVSGSSQITYSGLSSIPSGIISGSAQVISSLPSGTVSGSAQVSYTGLSNIPSGIISGSAQLTSTFVQKSGDTMTGQLIVGATGLAGAGTLKINNSSAATFNHSIEAFAANMTAGQTNAIFLGQAGSTKNAGYLGYNWSSSASNSNYVSLGHWGADNLFRVYGDGTVYMGTVTTGVWNGTAITNTYLANSSFHVGTTSISLGRASAAQTLSGVSIDGYSTSLNGYANQTVYTILDGPANGPVIKIRYDSATANRYIDIGSKDGNGAYSEGLKIYNGGTLTFGGNTIYHSGNLTNLNQLTNGPGYITSYTETDTLSSVTARGASTSTAISINNTLTVTSGRIIARTGGANTYGVFSGYDNNNHMMAFRSAISGPTATPTFTAGHQTTFVEYAEAGDATGWYFKSSSSGTYEEIVRITRTGVIPGTNGTQNLGSSSARWNTVFTSDLSMSNGIGDYTIVEGEEDLFIYNNKTNKVFKFLLQEVDPSIAPPKKV